HTVRRVIRTLNGLFHGVADTNLFHGSTHAGGKGISSAREVMTNYFDVKNSNMDTTDTTRPAEVPSLGECDVVDRLIKQWREARPDLDPSSLDVVGRVIVLAQHLERGVEIALERHGLSLGQFDILATLRRHGKKGGLTPSQLLESVMLSSGGMTARLDA